MSSVLLWWWWWVVHVCDDEQCTFMMMRSTHLWWYDNYDDVFKYTYFDMEDMIKDVIVVVLCSCEFIYVLFCLHVCVYLFNIQFK